MVSVANEQGSGIALVLSREKFCCVAENASPDADVVESFLFF